MPISALIADDEASARSRLRKLLAPYSFELVEGDAHDGLTALEAIQKHRPQVVFLDVEMPGLNGFEVVEALTPDLMPLIVFVTAYDEHALAAFDANAVAYLLKPVVEDRLRTVVTRIEQLVRSPGDAAQEAIRTSGVAIARPQPLHHVLAVQRDGYVLIPLNEVCSFQVEDGVTHVKTATASYRTNYAIGHLESRLPTPPFFRAHRATIANLDKVATISPMFKGALLLTMKDSAASEIQVSERQAKYVRELLQL
ncbi:MAG TPA: LytTR family DNA-binding domain-containing protein [Steroidobacteraceae bacterium]|nr:LytTR family DNA-binding domain-containing protein [Steroidobacteraceae bacterium]